MVRCRRWKPITHRKTWWCTDRSLVKCYALRAHVIHPITHRKTWWGTDRSLVKCYALRAHVIHPITHRKTWWGTDRSLTKCCALRVHVLHPYSRVSSTSGFNLPTFRLSRAGPSSHGTGVELFETCGHETDPSVDFGPEVSIFVDNAAEV